MPPKHKFTFNYVALYDDINDEWRIYRKLDKRIPKTVECYGNRFLSKSKTLKNAIENLKNPREVLRNCGESPSRFEIQIVKKGVIGDEER